ncbi:MAG: transaldolase family protein [Clostridia bacterium]
MAGSRKQSAMERLARTGKGMELWWDSNPLIYEAWCAKFLAAVPEDQREQLAEQLKAMWNEGANPNDWVFRGVTTNPPLTKAAFEYVKDEGISIIKDARRNHPSLGYREVAWEAYKAASQKGARRYLPLFEGSGYRFGFVCAQVDPALCKDTAEMVRQGLELWKLAPNVMIKVPASRAGVAAMRILTTLGVPINATLSFTLPQIMAVARAVKEGKQLGEKLGICYDKWRAVITLMIGRFEDAAIFREQAAQKGIQLTDELKRWSGIAVARKACQLLAEGNYPCKLLIASSRVGPTVDGQQRIWHIEGVVGRDVVYTMNPELIQSFMLLYSDRPIETELSKNEIPQTVMEQLLQAPYFAQAYSEDGIREEEFETIEPFVTTYRQFSGAMDDLASYVKKVLEG